MNESENTPEENALLPDEIAADEPITGEFAVPEYEEFEAEEIVLQDELAADADTPVDTFVKPFLADEPSEEMTVADLFDSAATIPMGMWQGDEPVEKQVRHKDIVLDRLPRIHTTSVCHVGAVRERNDDSCLVFESQVGGHFKMMPFGLYIVADGMGGHANGHVASKIASRVASHEIVKNIYLPLLRDTDGGSPTPIQEVLLNAGQKANMAVYQTDVESDSGTTLTGALLLGRRLYVFHVGDSRAYLFADGELEQITTDHSLVQRLQEVGQLTDEEAVFYQYRHVLLRAVGQGDQVEVDTYTRRLPKNGRLLLCSDGLCGLVSDSDMQAIIAQDIDLDSITEELFTAAIAAGGHDNITAVLVDFAF